jgi:predicted SAM-dependent methyltransferase
MSATTTTLPPSVYRAPAAAPDQPRPIVEQRSAWQRVRAKLRFVKSRVRMMFGAPLSTRWGLDRGKPAHRYYIELFLQEHADDIRGVCLEFADRGYLDQFGGNAVLHGDVMHMDASNEHATVIGDIAGHNDIPDNTYDCIICTHVLHVIPDVHAAVRGMHRILKPGGVLLCASPTSGWCDEAQGELWRFTRLGLEQTLERVFGPNHVHTRAFGNSIVAAGEIRGLIADEFTKRELHEHDARCPAEVCARAVKQG